MIPTYPHEKGNKTAGERLSPLIFHWIHLINQQLLAQGLHLLHVTNLGSKILITTNPLLKAGEGTAPVDGPAPLRCYQSALTSPG